MTKLSRLQTSLPVSNDFERSEYAIYYSGLPVQTLAHFKTSTRLEVEGLPVAKFPDVRGKKIGISITIFGFPVALRAVVEEKEGQILR